uniref:Uncharacterized protein n=1 Tax=Leersia perrieri TaxID=77586 RepID=A0A0D9XCJ9_9ORYZ
MCTSAGNSHPKGPRVREKNQQGTGAGGAGLRGGAGAEAWWCGIGPTTRRRGLDIRSTARFSVHAAVTTRNGDRRALAFGRSGPPMADLAEGAAGQLGDGRRGRGCRMEGGGRTSTSAPPVAALAAWVLGPLPHEAATRRLALTPHEATARRLGPPPPVALR